MISPATLPALSAWLPGPAASARVIAELYTLLLILSALLILTGIAAAALRAAPAGWSRTSSSAAVRWVIASVVAERWLASSPARRR